MQFAEPVVTTISVQLEYVSAIFDDSISQSHLSPWMMHNESIQR